MTRTARELYQNLVLDPSINPVAQRVVAAILAAIGNGSLIDDDPLPSSRRLAEAHNVSRSCVVQAYEILAGMGAIRSRHGSGTRVCPGASQLIGETCRTPVGAKTRSEPDDVLDMRVPAHLFRAVVDEREWNRAWRLATAPDAVGSGHRELTTALHNHLRSFRGMQLHPEQLILRPGLGSAMVDIVACLGLAGDNVVVEDPGHPRIQGLFVEAGCRVRRLPVDDEGLRVDMLTSADRAVHVTPARQWPTGVAMSPRRRAELMEWAARTGGVVIENDLDAEFTYGRAPEPTLFQAASSAARVIYLGSPYRLLGDDLAIVWLVVDYDFHRRPNDVAPISECPARALANYLNSGALYRHRNRALTLCRDRRDALLRALAHEVPQVTTSGEQSGTEVVLHLPAGATELGVQMQLERARYRVSTLGEFAMRRRDHALVLHYGDLTPSTGRRFARSLQQALAGLT